MDQRMRLLVFPSKDIAGAKKLFNELLGVAPYADAPYYAGYKTGDLEIGLDPNASTDGPLPYWEVDDLRASLQKVLDAGAELVQDVKDVGGGKLIAQVKDANGNTIGLMQAP
jgi:predicted enzyme related to lactoylglutathione lyase